MYNYILILLFIIIIIFLYFYRISKLKYKTNLQFIHIPKNAGTTIENVGDKHNIKWGRFNDDLKNYTDFNECTYWHTPPSKFNKNSYYNLNKTFCVYRDPYERIVSEFKYRNNSKTLKKEDLNNWIQNDLPNLFKQKYLKNCHIIPQYDFIFDENGNKTCDIILDFDNLNNDFNNLMKDYNYNVKLNNLKLNSSNSNLTVNDLDENSKKIINKLYKDDFKIKNLINKNI